MTKEEIVVRAKAALLPKKQHLIRLFGRLGLIIKQLNTKELIRLLYQIYNQESVLGDNSITFSKRGALIKGERKLNKNGLKHFQKAQAEEEPARSGEGEPSTQTKG